MRLKRILIFTFLFCILVSILTNFLVINDEVKFYHMKDKIVNVTKNLKKKLMVFFKVDGGSKDFET